MLLVLKLEHLGQVSEWSGKTWKRWKICMKQGKSQGKSEKWGNVWEKVT